MPEKLKRYVTIVDPAEWPEDLTSNVNWKLLQACTLRHVPVVRAALSKVRRYLLSLRALHEFSFSPFESW